MNPILQKIENGTLVLTANDRLARFLTSEYDRLQQQNGRKAWVRPSVFPATTWCRQKYESLDGSRPPVSVVQGNLVWESIVDSSVRETEHELLQVSQTARMAWKAESLLRSYRASFRPGTGTGDQEMFLRWQTSWRKRINDAGMIDPAEIPHLVADSINQGRLELPGEIIFAGYDELEPDLQLLHKSMRDAGCLVSIQAAAPHRKSEGLKLRCHDRRDETVRCVAWIKRQLQTNPDARIGVVAPQLEHYRDLVEPVFRAELEPAAALQASAESPPYNLSLAPRLSDEACVCAALKLLAVDSVIRVDELGWLLRSPYLARADSERYARAACERGIRNTRQAEFSLWQLSSLLKKHRCDEAFLALTGHLAAFHKSGRKQLPGVWAERIANLLSLCGWPGSRGLSSREYQAVERFRVLLSELASLDSVAPRITGREAVARLQRMATETMFQPEGIDTNIHIVGILEAGGMHFDAIWILGMHAGAMPQRPQPNPFIPVSLQRELRMPHADSERELSYADRLMSRLFAAAPQVVASWPAQEGGLPFVMSHYLEEFQDIDLESMPSSNPTRVFHRAPVALERLEDNSAPSVVSRKTISGGTAIVRDQALCPFRAFAHHRLRAEGLEETDIGIDAMTRGRLLHGALEYFWKQTRSQQNLLDLSHDELTRRLEESATFAVLQDEERNRSVLPARQRALELRRLVRQVRKWLEVDRKRSSFEVVGTEKSHVEVMGRLKFRTIVDRIDRLDTGRLAFIDYKSGQPDPTQWFTDRLTEPQLPIYCQQVEPDEIEAVLFAQVRPRDRDCRFLGIARDSSHWPGVTEKTMRELLAERGWASFDQVVSNWRDILPGLGDAFIDGVAVVDPVDPEKACRYCDLMPLCRIREKDCWQVEESV